MFFLKIGYAHSIQTPRRSSIPWPALRCGTGDGHSTLTMGLNQQKLRFNRKHGMMMMMVVMMMVVMMMVVVMMMMVMMVMNYHFPITHIEYVYICVIVFCI